MTRRALFMLAADSWIKRSNRANHRFVKAWNRWQEQRSKLAENFSPESPDFADRDARLFADNQLDECWRAVKRELGAGRMA